MVEVVIHTAELEEPIGADLAQEGRVQISTNPYSPTKHNHTPRQARFDHQHSFADKQQSFSNKLTNNEDDSLGLSQRIVARAAASPCGPTRWSSCWDRGVPRPPHPGSRRRTCGARSPGSERRAGE